MLTLVTSSLALHTTVGFWSTAESFVLLYGGSALASALATHATVQLMQLHLLHVKRQYTERVQNQLQCEWMLCDYGWNQLSSVTRFRTERIALCIVTLQGVASALSEASHIHESSVISREASVRRLGASGAVCGVCAALLICVLFNTQHHTLHSIFFAMSALYTAAEEFRHVFNLLVNFTASNDSIDHVAHIGGMLFGALFAIVVLAWQRSGRCK